MTITQQPQTASFAGAYEDSRVLAQWLRRFGGVVAMYVAVTLATGATWMGDTVDYVESIVYYNHGIDHWMWDFAHLLWRPLGWLVSVIVAPLTRLVVGRSESLNVMLTLNAISWIAGLAALLALFSLATHFSGRAWIAYTVAAGFLFTQSVLNWTHAGSAYIPGLALLLAALQLIVLDRQQTWRTAIISGVLLAAAVCVWVPYLLVVPAVVLAPAILSGATRARLRAAVYAFAAFTICTGIAYLAVMGAQHMTSIQQLRDWIALSSHGVDYHGGKRMIFGYTRAFLNTGNDGVMFKRYLLHDPFNPVTLRDLLGATIWKIAFVHLFSAILVVKLFATNKRLFVLFAIAAMPVLTLAFFFGSSEPERYLPLVPVFFIAIASCLATPSRFFRSATLAFLAAVIAVNSAAMAKPVLDRDADRAAARVGALIPRLDDRSIVFTATYQDELMTFARTYPFHALNRSGRLHVSTLVSPGTSWNEHWCEDFASRVLTTWKRGGTTWVALRVRSERPLADWRWSEGDDARVSWHDFPLLFSHVDLGESVGGSDGFVQLLPTSKNKQFLSSLTTPALIAERNSARSQSASHN